jgi:orotate phosphoribosyltransferase
MLDVRVAIAQARLLRPIVSHLVEVLDCHGVRQVAGRGYGSFLLVGGILAADDRLRGGLVRETRKGHGTRRLVEGSLEPARPLLIVDDVLSSGRSAAALATRLRADGYDPRGVLAIFGYGWRGGAPTLRTLGLTVETMATIHPPVSGAA